MTVENNKLQQVPYTAAFEDCFKITRDMKIILNSIRVYGCNIASDGKTGMLDKEINFEIKFIDNDIVLYPLKKFPKYLMLCERNIIATAIKVDAKDCPMKDIYIDKNGRAWVKYDDTRTYEITFDTRRE